MLSGWFVLVGGDAYSMQGGDDLAARELVHTSLTFVGNAYAELRRAGVPRRQIITIVQLHDYLRSPHLSALPSGQPHPIRQIVEKECELLLREGGSDYDFEKVNPCTIWAVLLGLESARYPKVVPQDTNEAIVFGIYSHGDSHPTTEEGFFVEEQKENALKRKRKDLTDVVEIPEELNYFNNEWFAHLPFGGAVNSKEDQRIMSEMLEMVAHEACHSSRAVWRRRDRPTHFFYASQLRCVLAKLFNRPKSPKAVVGLLNFCRSGGAIDFLSRPAARKGLGVDTWPVMLMSSSQAHHDALVGGLWTPFFNILSEALISWSSHATKEKVLNSKDSKIQWNTIGEVYRRAKTRYLRENACILRDHVTVLAYPSNFGADDDNFPVEVAAIVAAEEGGEPDYKAADALQKRYRKKGIKIWHPQRWHGKEVSLSKAIRDSVERIAHPSCTIGKEGTSEATIHSLFFQGESESHV